MRYTKTIAALSVVATGTAIQVAQPPTDFNVYIHGSAAVPHDLRWGLTVDSDIDYGLYCSEDTAELYGAKAGDVAITMRVGSAVDCNYKSTLVPTIAVTGFDNDARWVGDGYIENTLVISNGSNYGKSINYYIPAGSLSEAMPLMANILTAINEARLLAGMLPLTTEGMRTVLDQSSDDYYEHDGKYFGQYIDLDEAIRIATAIPEPSNLGWLSAVLYLILNEE